MRRIDRPRQSIVSHRRHPARLGLGQAGIGGNDGDGRVLCGTRRRRRAGQTQDLSRIGQRAVRIANAGDDLSRGGIDDVADGVDRDDGGDDEAVGPGDGKRADARLHRQAASRRVAGMLRNAAELSDSCARSCADVAFGDGAGRGGHRSFVAAVGSRPDPRVAAEAKVKQDGARNNRHHALRGLVADVPLLEILDDALRRVEAEGAATRQHHGVDAFDEIGRIEEVCFARARCAAALRDAADGTFTINQHDRASRRPLGERVMPDLQPGDIGQPLASSRRRLRQRCRGEQSGDGESERNPGHGSYLMTAWVFVSHAVMAPVTSRLIFRSVSVPYSVTSPVTAGTRR